MISFDILVKVNSFLVYLDERDFMVGFKIKFGKWLLEIFRFEL